MFLICFNEYLYRFAEESMKIFKIAIVVQFLTSSSLFSIAMYHLFSSIVLDLLFITHFLVIFCMYLEFFFYFWFGSTLTHEVFTLCNDVSVNPAHITKQFFYTYILLQSEQFGLDILNIDWTALTPTTSKMILLMSLRATNRPIIVCVAHFIELSLN